jgi:hypothetical protein
MGNDNDTLRYFNEVESRFASWHIFTCHNALWSFKNSHNANFRVVAFSLMSQRVVVVLKQPQQDISRCGSFSNARTRCGRFFRSLSVFDL